MANLLRTLSLVLFALSFTPLVQAQAWPTKPVRIIVPFPPGGASDIVARLIGDKLSVAWGQPVVMDYKPGAGGTIATAELVKSTGGHTLMIGTLGTHAVAPSLYKSLPFDPAKDLVPVVLLVQTPMVAVASPTLPVKTLAEFGALVKANPGKYAFASPGNGTLNHLMGEMYKRSAGLDMDHIPYKGGTYVDLIAGRTSLLFDPVAQALPQIRQGNLRPLGISHRSSVLPGVPTLVEAGFPDADIGLWIGLFASADMPAAGVARTSSDALVALRAPDVIEKVEGLSSQVVALPNAAFARLYLAELARWKKVTTDFGVKND
jgi:tripartite-type tricarboxylate transporter receptor subunit TctC